MPMVAVRHSAAASPLALTLRAPDGAKIDEVNAMSSMRNIGSR